MADIVLTEIRVIISGGFEIAERVAAAARTAAGQTFVRMAFGRAGLDIPPDDGQQTFRCQHPFRYGPSNRCVLCGDVP